MNRLFFMSFVVLVTFSVVIAIPSHDVFRQLKRIHEVESKSVERFIQVARSRRMQGQSVPPEIEQCQTVTCPSQSEICDALINCVVNALNSLVVPCLDSFGSIGTVYRCLLGFLLKGGDVATSIQASDFEALGVDIEGAFGAVTPNPTQQVCLDFFAPGKESAFASVACLSRLQSAQSLVNFAQAAENNFAGNSQCASLASLLDGINGEGGEGSDSSEESDNTAQLDPALNNITAFVNTCDQYTGINGQIDAVLSDAGRAQATLLFAIMVTAVLNLL